MIRPLGDYVLIRLKSREDEKRRGFYVPDTSKEKPCEGMVQAVGQGRLEGGHRIGSEFEPGQIVLFAKEATKTWEHDDVVEVWVHEKDVLGVLGPT